MIAIVKSYRIFCTSDDPCQPNPCLTYGTCRRDYYTAHYECACQAELIGQHCQYGMHYLLSVQFDSILFATDYKIKTT